MKPMELTSIDSFPSLNAWMVRTPHRVPRHGEEIVLDGKRVVVRRTQQFRDELIIQVADAAGPQAPQG